MSFRFKIRFFQTLLLISAVFFMSSVAQAVSSHRHHGKIDVASPFDKIHKDKPSHCVLNFHQHSQDIVCPHMGQDVENTGQTLLTGCGPTSGSANSSSLSFVNNLFENTTYENFMSLRFFWKIESPSSFKNEYLPRFIDHPPQLS